MRYYAEVIDLEGNKKGTVVYEDNGEEAYKRLMRRRDVTKVLSIQENSPSKAGSNYVYMCDAFITNKGS